MEVGTGWNLLYGIWVFLRVHAFKAFNWLVRVWKSGTSYLHRPLSEILAVSGGKSSFSHRMEQF